jgi:hypothetical protein
MMSQDFRMLSRRLMMIVIQGIFFILFFACSFYFAYSLVLTVLLKTSGMAGHVTIHPLTPYPFLEGNFLLLVGLVVCLLAMSRLHQTLLHTLCRR